MTIYDGLGSLTQVAMAGGTRSFEYDATTRVLTRDAFASGAGGTFWIERLMRDENQSPLYDEAGNLLEVRGSSSASHSLRPSSSSASRRAFALSAESIQMHLQRRDFFC